MKSSLLPVVLLLESAVPGSLVPEVRRDIAANHFEQAEAKIRSFESAHGVTPEMLEALSWLGRGALAAHKLEAAAKYAARTQLLAERALAGRKLDSDPQLAIALGAGIEVQGHVWALEGDRAGAVAYLTGQLARYHGTSVRARIQKNINLLSLEGKPAPALEAREFLGPRPPSLASLKGHPVLLFFWAHWCSDCKALGPVLAALAEEFRTQGLVIIAPTQRYGYAARGAEATPAEELLYIDHVRHKYYQPLLQVPVPVSDETFKVYGCSTVPTLVLVDRQGIVRLYHPGPMSHLELSAKLKVLLR